ncbi:MAG TPA: type 1 glutamine amidotransferase domain-containing protein, partial [Pseudomonas sp.]|nr:type 1 glutamine amidotransferase domain-containing protein [Pseudomonas sp.]
MTKRIVHVVINVEHYSDRSHKTGRWLRELTQGRQVVDGGGG